MSLVDVNSELSSGTYVCV